MQELFSCLFETGSLKNIFSLAPAYVFIEYPDSLYILFLKLDFKKPETWNVILLE